MWRGLTTWWRCAFEFPREQRGLFYQILRAQLGAGVAPATACETLAERVRVSKRMSQVAAAGARAARDGRGVVEGLSGTLCFPAEDVGIMRIAERSAALEQALADLSRAQAERLGIVSQILAPNAYFLIMLGLGVFFGAQVADLLSVVGDQAALDANDAYVLSLGIRTYGPPFGIVFGVAAAIVAFGRLRWHGRMRKLLWAFDDVYRAQTGIRFADFAAGLYERGASHPAVLDAVQEAFGRRGFVGRSVDRARRDLAGGMAFEDAVAHRLLTRDFTEILKGLVPGGDMRLYPAGMRALAAMQRALLRRRLGVARTAVRTVALAAVGMLIAIMAPGIYSAFTVAI